MPAKRVLKKSTKSARVHGKSQVVYFKGDRLGILAKLQARAKSKKIGVSDVIVEALEAAL